MGLLDFLKPIVCPLELKANGDLVNQLAEAQSELRQSQSDYAKEVALSVDLNNKILLLQIYQKDVNKLKADNAALLAENNTLKAGSVEPPSAYPVWMKPGNVYEPSTSIVRPDGFRDSIHIPVRFFYPRFDDLQQLVLDSGWLNLSTVEEKLSQILKWVILNHSYQADLGEDWRPAQETFYYKRGDCEDSTILWVTLCRLAGVPADRVFNAIGSFNGMGHSFGVGTHDDGRLYLYETTLSTPPSSIKAFDGNGPYAIDCLVNWKYVGVLK